MTDLAAGASFAIKSNTADSCAASRAIIVGPLAAGTGARR
jgi:hypothetical protein